MNVIEEIKQTISSHPVVLYMKGTPDFPQCGFSGKVVHILKQHGVKDIKAVNVLENPEVRQGIKDFTQWPTIPQLYLDGEFIGGCDIISEMHDNGELAKLLAKG